MNIPFLAPAAIQFRYRGTSPLAGLVFWNNSGTGGAGTLTLNDSDDGETEYDLGSASYDTAAELVAALNARTDEGWEARLYCGHPLAPISGTTVISGAAAFSSISWPTNLPSVWTDLLTWVATTETIGTSSTSLIARALPIPAAGVLFSKAVCDVTLSGAGTDNVTFELVSANPQATTEQAAQEGYREMTPLGDSDWDTDGNLGEMVVEANGATQVRKNFPLDLRGFGGFIKLGKVTNASGTRTAAVSGHYAYDPYQLSHR